MGSRFFEAMLRSAGMIAVDDPHAKARQERRGFSTHDALERTELPNAPANEFGGDVRFEVVKFIIDGFDRNGKIVFMALDGVVDGGGVLEDDFEHEGHELGEEEFSLILFFGGVGEEFVELFGREESLEDGPVEDGEGGVFFKVVEEGVVRGHGCFLSRGCECAKREA